MKIICIGRNYALHAKELDNVVPEEPAFFMKPDTALLPKRNPFYIPEFSNNIHFECELVLRIGKPGKHIQEEFAIEYIDSIGIGIDFTARDVQEVCKSKSLPWEKAKAFDHSAPVSEKFIPKTSFSNLKNIDFSLYRNGQIAQQGNSADMLFSFEKIISYLSRFVTLKIGDYIFTGTPAGVAQTVIGDKLECFIGNEKLLTVNVR